LSPTERRPAADPQRRPARAGLRVLEPGPASARQAVGAVAAAVGVVGAALVAVAAAAAARAPAPAAMARQSAVAAGAHPPRRPNSGRRRSEGPAAAPIAGRRSAPASARALSVCARAPARRACLTSGTSSAAPRRWVRPRVQPTICLRPPSEVLRPPQTTADVSLQ